MPWGWYFSGWDDDEPEPPRAPGVNQGKRRGVTKSAKPKPRRGRR
jgi:hypothetical protein